MFKQFATILVISIIVLFIAYKNELSSSQISTTPTKTVSRSVHKVARGIKTKDGAGVSLERVIGGSIAQKDVDPFLMLDAFRSDNPDDYIAGFPNHPHRGFQTVTYMIDGLMEHMDTRGNQGLLTPGSVQWMTAGRGIIHSEIPKQKDGLMFGFQFWLNLAAKEKMIEPSYQDIPPEKIPEVIDNTKKVRVIAGNYENIEGPVKGIRVQPMFLDVKLQPGASFSVDIPDFDHNAFVYVFEGEGLFGPPDNQIRVSDRYIGVLENIDKNTLTQDDIKPTKLDAVAGKKGVRFLFLSAKPLREKIAQRGPIVMNTQEELRQAFIDYESGRFA